ncbi:hypothetical protein KBD59_01635 [Candidatus Gracilibacteria bacterium]|nr:hypothetical protein [Candidatus Gracilibacteria bacterium]
MPNRFEAADTEPMAAVAPMTPPGQPAILKAQLPENFDVGAFLNQVRASDTQTGPTSPTRAVRGNDDVDYLLGA